MQSQLLDRPICNTPSGSASGFYKVDAMSDAVQDALGAMRIKEANKTEPLQLLDLLQFVSGSAHELLDAADFEVGINAWLREMALRTGAARATFYENAVHANGNTMAVLAEWTRPELSVFTSVSFTAPYCIDPNGAEELLDKLHQGRHAEFHVSNTVGFIREMLVAQGNASVLTMPIMIKGASWGAVGFDFLTHQDFTPRYIAILQTAADTLASVINRNQVQTARVAEQKARADENAALAKLLESVALASRKLIAEADFEAGVMAYLQIVGTALNAARACFYDYRWHEDAERMTFAALCEWVQPGIEKNLVISFAKPVVFDPRGVEPFFDQVANGDLVVVHTEETQGLMREITQAQGNATVICVPVFVGGAVKYSIGFDSLTHRELDSQTRRVLEMAADAMSAAVKRWEIEKLLRETEAARLEEQRERARFAERQGELLAAVVSASELLLKAQSLEEVANAVVAKIGQALSADRCIIGAYLPPDERDPYGYLNVAYEWTQAGISRQSDHPELKLLAGSLYIDFVQPLFRGEPFAVITDDIESSEARSEQELIEAKSQFQYPIMVDGKFWGSLGVDDCHHPRVWSPTEIDSLCLVTSALASVAKREQLTGARIKVERERAQFAERQGELLAAVVSASELLLKAQILRDVAHEVIARIGQALMADRCVIGLCQAPDANDAYGYLDFEYEWVNTGIARQTDQPGLKVFGMSAYIDFVEPLLRGEAIALITDDIENNEARIEQEQTGAKSQFMYPIMVDGKLWGVLGPDDCHHPRVWSPTEIDSLRLVASALSSVVKRELLIEARIEAERERAQFAERQGELLAAVVSASELLLKAQSLEDVADQVVAMIGRALNADRCMIGLYLPPDEESAWGYAEFDYEWVEAGTARQTDQPELKRFDLSMYLDFLKPMLRGEAVPIMTEEIQSDEARGEQEETGAKSQFVYPIMVDGKLWGFLDTDDCHHPRVWSPTEIDSLRLVASALGSVVKRGQLTEARIEAERQRESARRAGQIAVVGERNRIAREIHDTLAQGFTGVIMQSQAAEDALLKQDAPATIHHLHRARTIAQTSLHDARRSVFALRPSVLNDQTLAQALAVQIKRMLADSAVAGSFEEHGSAVMPSNLVATELLRIAQEATTNVLRHADATKICVQLQWEADGVKLSIGDNGRGFDVKQEHPGFGLVSMRERADRMQAVLMIESSCGAGTAVSISVNPGAGSLVLNSDDAAQIGSAE
jgi:signal transduction histidine kinase